MSSNSILPPGQSGFAANRYEDMSAYDQLPPRLRLALRNTRYEMASEPVLQALRKGVPEGAVLIAILRTDAEEPQPVQGDRA